MNEEKEKKRLTFIERYVNNTQTRTQYVQPEIVGELRLNTVQCTCCHLLNECVNGATKTKTEVD